MNISQFVNIVLAALCTFVAATVIIVVIAITKNNEEWIDKAGGDLELARKLKKTYWEENHEA